ncbi:MAG: helix-turn-helix transcriptional regulator [Phycisphaerae bacterium]
MARGETLFRQWELLKTLQAHRFGLDQHELARRLECTRRTVQRDLDTLKDLFPIRYEQRDFGKRYWKLAGHFIESEKLQLSLPEMLSLYLSQQLLEPLAGTPFGDGVATAIEKIKAILPAEALNYFAGLDEAFLIKNLAREDYTGMAEQIRTLNEAILDRRIVRVEYNSASQGRSVVSLLHPYGMVLLSASLYCIGYLAEYDEVRTLKVSRLESVHPTGKSFTKPEGFSLASHTAGSFGIFGPSARRDIRVRFTGWAATNVREQTWHDTQEICDEDEEGLTCRFRLDNTVEFKRWVLGFGRFARVIEPAELAEDIAAELAAAVENYRRE